MDRWNESAIGDVIGISLHDRIASDIEVIGDLSSGDYPQIARHRGIDRRGKFFNRDGMLQFQLRDLTRGMNSGIGAPRAGDAPIFAKGFGNRLFQCFLHGSTIRLDLPADEISSVVIDEKSYAAQRRRIRNDTERRRMPKRR